MSALARAVLAWLSPWLLLGLLAALTAWRYAPPPALPADAPPERFSAGRALEALEGVLDGEAPHPVGSVEGARVAARITERLREHGLEVALDEGLACGPYSSCAPVRNLVARVPGRRPELGAVLVVAHHDSVGAGPGASDDGHGVAVLLELARLADTRSWDRDVVLLVTDGEEAGLIGAERFAQQTLAFERERFVFAINLEARGTGGPSVLFESHADEQALAGLYGEVAPRPIIASLARPVYEALPHDTDFSVLARHGLRGANLAFIDGGGRYHTPRDDLAHLDPGSLQHQGDHVLALVDAMADADCDLAALEGNRGGVYFDLLAWHVVRWPAGTALVLALVALALALAALAAAWRRGRLRPVPALAATLLWPLVLALAAAAPVGLALGLRALGALPAFVPFTANAAPLLLASLALVLALVSGAAALLRRWLDPWAWLAAAALGHGALALGSAWLVEAASYLFVVPALACALGAVLAAALPERHAAHGPLAATLVAVCGAALVVLPAAWLLHMATGIGPIQPATTLSALLLVTILPVLSAWPLPSLRRGLPLAALATALLAALLGWSAGPWDADHPQPINLVYREHHASGAAPEAHWLAMTLHDPLPDELQAAAAFTGALEPMTPWAHPLRTVDPAPAEALGLEPPRLERLPSSTPAIAPGMPRHTRVRLRSPRGAPLAAVYWTSPRVVAASLDGYRVGLQESPWRGVDLYGLPRDGIELDLEILGEAPVEVWLMDKAYGLPERGRFLLDALPGHSAPVQDGHASLVTTVVQL